MFVFLKKVFMSRILLVANRCPLWIVMSKKSIDVVLISYVNFIVS